MRSQPTITIATYALLCLAGGVSFMIPAEIPVPASPRPAQPPPCSTGTSPDEAMIDLRIDGHGIASRSTLADRVIVDRLDGAARSFALTATADFVYRSCAGQFLSLDGDEATWLFIDGDLVCGPDTAARIVALDDLDLTDGASHRLLLVHARRAAGDHRVRMRARVSEPARPLTRISAASGDSFGRRTPR